MIIIILYKHTFIFYRNEIEKNFTEILSSWYSKKFMLGFILEYQKKDLTIGQKTIDLLDLSPK